MEYCKERLAKAEARAEELQSIVEKQQTTISELTAEVNAAYRVATERLQYANALWRHMGRFSRWTWKLKDKK